MDRVKIEGQEYNCNVLEYYPDGDARVQIIDPDTNYVKSVHIVSENQFIDEAE